MSPSIEPPPVEVTLLPRYAAVLPPRHIEILTFPSGQILNVTGPLQVFATVNDLAANAGRSHRHDAMWGGGTSQSRGGGLSRAVGLL